MDSFAIKLFLYLVIIFSAIFHEYAHAWIADYLGDSTAKNMGRLTLNPLPHLDLFGTVIIPLSFLFLFGGFIGWAKPVPYNPYNLRDKKYGSLKVGLAGPGANIVIAVAIGLIIRFFGSVLLASGFIPAAALSLLGLVVYINIFLALFNLIPVPPLDGSKIFEDLFPGVWRSFSQIGIFGIFIAIFIAFYFLAPLANLMFQSIVGQPFLFY